MRYSDLSTNAGLLSEAQTLTRVQIDALARLEDDYANTRGHAAPERVEDVLHVFMCTAMGACVCTNPKEV